MSLKLTLITSLVTVSVAGISTGGYFLFRGSENREYKPEPGKGSVGSDGEPGADTPAAKAAIESAKRLSPPPPTSKEESQSQKLSSKVIEK